MGNARMKQDRGVSALGRRDADRQIFQAKQADRRRRAETRENPNRPWGYLVVRVSETDDE